MKIYHHLFFLDKDMVAVIEYGRQSEKKFSYITKQGEKKFLFTEDFWKWWKDAMCYIPGELADFCFIYDKEYEMFSRGFVKNMEKSVESCWTETIVRDFLSEMLEYTHITLIGCNGNKITVDKANNEFLDNSPKIFYTDKEYKVSNNNVPVKEDNRISPLAGYYRELLISERQQ